MADLRSGRIGFTGVELQTLVQDVLTPAFKGRRLKTAVIVREPVQYGVARQQSVFSEAYFELEVFTDPAEARAWALG